MLPILGLIEFVACGLVTSAIAWVRHLYGAPRMYRDWEVRYLVPFLILIVVVGSIFLSVTHGVAPQQPDSYPPEVGLALVLGITLVALVAWLVIEVGRYGARHRSASHGNRPYSHIASPQRRARPGRGKNGAR
jgi:hypothetical protein